MTSLRGSLASPGYPNPYPGDVDCVWEIQAVKGNSIDLNFVDVDLAPSKFCNQDFIEVRRSETDYVIGLYCGKQYPENTIQVYDKVLIRFHSAAGSTGKGFKMEWSYGKFSSMIYIHERKLRISLLGHKNEFKNQTKGSIEAPPLKAAGNEEEPFSWRVLVSRESYISLEFQQYTDGLKVSLIKTTRKLDLISIDMILYVSYILDISHFYTIWRHFIANCANYLYD